MTISRQFSKPQPIPIIPAARAALETILQGFLDHPANGLCPDDRGRVHALGLRLLLRLLFLLSAGRPACCTTSTQGDLRRLCQEVASSPTPTGTHGWDRLQQILQRLDGGLFCLVLEPSLEAKVLGDRPLAQAIRLLEQALSDQGALEPHQLGFVYEGLLAGDTRKAGGSFYTPRYIVRFIVERTLGPLLEEAGRRAQARAEEGAIAVGPALVEEVLQLKVLDPAMGGGHFLLEATAFLAQALADNPLVQDLAAGEPLPYWKQQVVENCIYGLDKDPLAVELARLSLWLAVGPAGRPPACLAQRLCCGDALVGARVADLATLPPPILGPGGSRQLDFLGSVQYVGGICDPPDRRGCPPGQVQRSEGSPLPLPLLRALADLWVSAHLGHTSSPDDYEQSLALLETPDQLLALPAVQRARRIARERAFFHWDLAFPELLYDHRGRPLEGRGGFHAVLGNPPYLFGENIPAEAKPFLDHHYLLARGSYDIYWLFFERALDLLADGGFYGYIVPDALLARDRTEALRRMLLQRNRLLAVAPVGTVFPDPQVSAVVMIGRRGRPAGNSVQTWRREGRSFYQAGRYPQALLAKIPRCRLWVNLDADELDLVMGIVRRSLPLGDYVEVSRGEELGRKDLMPIGDRGTTKDENVGASAILRIGVVARPQLVPILTGRDVTPLGDLRPGQGIPVQRVQKPVDNYVPDKIVLVKTGRRLVATVDSVGWVTLQSVYNLRLRAGRPTSPYYLAGLLKSTLLSYILRATVTGYKQIFPQLNQSTVREIPVRRVAFSTPLDLRARLLEEGLALTAAWVEGGLEAASKSFPTFRGSALGRWLAERLAPQHHPGPVLVRQHDAGPLGQDDPFSEAGPLEQADVIHDLLARLAAQMIELNGARRDLAQAFLDWLEVEIGASVDQLAGKTALRHYLGDVRKGTSPLAWEALLGILHRNRRLLRVDPTDRFFQGRLARAYESNLACWQPLRARLAATDRLIDLLVYQLYGLDEAEVALVEASP